MRKLMSQFGSRLNTTFHLLIGSNSLFCGKLKQILPNKSPGSYIFIYLLKSFHGISQSDERDFILKTIRLICYKYKHRANYKTEKKVATRINQIVQFCYLDAGRSDIIN